MEPQDNHITDTPVEDYEKRVDIRDGPRPKDESPHTDSLRQASTSASHHGNTISLHAVQPASVTLEHLTVSVDEAPSALAKLFSKKKAPPNQSHVKTILDDISAEMPSGKQSSMYDVHVRHTLTLYIYL